MNLALNTAIGFYLASLILYTLKDISHRKILAKIARLSILSGLISNAICVGIRWQATGYVPLTNMFESMVFFGLTIATVYLVFDILYKADYVGIIASLLALLALSYASFSDSTIKPLMPALQSNWLAIHVITTFIGYAGFACSFASGLVYLLLKNDISDLVVYKSTAFGFLFLTIGIITGAVWAEKAWGSYWSWDPKETWALITWLIYAVYIHIRIMHGIKGRLSAWLAILGFLAVIFTYFGVNYLLSGLHSYAHYFLLDRYA